MKKLILVLFICFAMIGCVLAAVPSVNLTVTTTTTTAPELIGGSMGMYLVQANVNGANVSFDSDYKGVISNGTLNVSVYTTGTPYRTISVQAPGYALYTANITQYPGNQETIDIPVTLVPLAAQTTYAVQANATAPASTSAAMTTATASPATTTSGSLPFAACGAFVVVGIFAIRSRR
jgi:hypothetical protein